jgi:two-component system OmpR family response regulator
MSEKKRILAVDDEPDVLLIIKTALLSEGYNVRTAPGAEEALAQIQEFRPHLVLLDMMMPRMSGFDALHAIREIPEFKSLPVIMLTGLSDKDNIKKALNMGVEYYMMKPFEFHDLISKVKIAISDSEKSSPS